MRRHKLTRKHKLLILLIQPGNTVKPWACRHSNGNLVEAFRSIWKINISKRHLRRLIGQLEKDRIIKRIIFAWKLPKGSSYLPINTCEIIDAEKGFSDLFTPK